MPVPQVDFSILGDLGKTYQENYQQGAVQGALRGMGPNLNADSLSELGKRIMQAGNLDQGLKLVTLGEQMKQSAQFANVAGGIVGNQPTMGTPSVTAPQPRAPIQPSARVWGDQEATDAGLYEPTAVPQRAGLPPPPNAPSAPGIGPPAPITSTAVPPVRVAQGPPPMAGGASPAMGPTPVPTQQITPQGATPQSRISAALPQLLYAAVSPFAAPEQKAVALELLKSGLGETAATELMKNARASGLQSPAQFELFVKNNQFTPEQKNARASGFPSPLQYESRKTEATELGKGAATSFEEAGKNNQAAQTAKYRLDLIDHSINTLGPEWMGTKANLRADAAKAWNTLAVTMLPQETAKKYLFNPDKIATAEDFSKQTINLGFELARTLGSREAQNIVQQAVNSVPNASQTFLGAKLVSSSLRQASQRQEDHYNFLVGKQRAGQSLVGADAEFNRMSPPEKYSMIALSNVGQPVHVTSPEQVKWLPKGAMAIGPDGKAYRKP